MYQTVIQKLDGNKAKGSNGEDLLFLGNLPVQVGSPVWTDGKYIYGDVPLRSTPYIPTETKGIPIAYKSDSENTFTTGYFKTNGTFKSCYIKNDFSIVNDKNKFETVGKKYNGEKVIDAEIAIDSDPTGSETTSFYIVTDGLYIQNQSTSYKKHLFRMKNYQNYHSNNLNSLVNDFFDYVVYGDSVSKRGDIYRDAKPLIDSISKFYPNGTRKPDRLIRFEILVAVESVLRSIVPEPYYGNANRLYDGNPLLGVKILNTGYENIFSGSISARTGQTIKLGISEEEKNINIPIKIFKNNEPYLQIDLSTYTTNVENKLIEKFDELMQKSEEDAEGKQLENWLRRPAPPDYFIASTIAYPMAFRIQPNGEWDAIIFTSSFGYCFPYAVRHGAERQGLNDLVSLDRASLGETRNFYFQDWRCVTCHASTTLLIHNGVINRVLQLKANGGAIIEDSDWWYTLLGGDQDGAQTLAAELNEDLEESFFDDLYLVDTSTQNLKCGKGENVRQYLLVAEEEDETVEDWIFPLQDGYYAKMNFEGIKAIFDSSGKNIGIDFSTIRANQKYYHAFFDYDKTFEYFQENGYYFVLGKKRYKDNVDGKIHIIYPRKENTWEDDFGYATNNNDGYGYGTRILQQDPNDWRTNTIELPEYCSFSLDKTETDPDTGLASTNSETLNLKLTYFVDYDQQSYTYETITNGYCCTLPRDKDLSNTDIPYLLQDCWYAEPDEEEPISTGRDFFLSEIEKIKNRLYRLPIPQICKLNGEQEYLIGFHQDNIFKTGEGGVAKLGTKLSNFRLREIANISKAKG